MVLLGDWAQLDGSSWASHVVAVTWFLGLESREGKTGLCNEDGALTQPVAGVACGLGARNDLDHRTCPWPRHVAWTSHRVMLGSKREHFKGEHSGDKKQTLPGHLHLLLEQVWALSSGL